MTAPPRIVVDTFERSSGVAEKLRALGARVEITALPAGDYLLGNSIVVERKQVLDLHSAVARGRFWRQLGALRATGKRPYLIVEGASIDDGPLGANAIRGILVAALENGIRLVQTRDRDDTARWLHRLAIRAIRTQPRFRPAYAQRPQPAEVTPEAMLGAVRGISTGAGRRLLDRFGSIAGIANATPTEWQTVPGIGPRRAAALAEALGVDIT